jgi:hypothetical protein
MPARMRGPNHARVRSRIIEPFIPFFRFPLRRPHCSRRRQLNIEAAEVLDPVALRIIQNWQVFIMNLAPLIYIPDLVGSFWTA